MAMVMLVIGGMGMLYLAIEWLAGHRPIGVRPLLIYSATLLGVGAQFLSLGILAELVTWYNLRPSDTYSVAERIEPRAEADTHPHRP
jgi:hypothetical protein